ncbi:glycoside hydrolase superfamily [Elsinoe ampelina]|uniref:Glycoside hydrolase superfamily n=1 Tax=Elsinoe ampelina TaxID=302913 RepID=A0A6A6GFS9_9PEZI|nr:glycoside hydrolase superfamily [Elsinoe ampelina]
MADIAPRPDEPHKPRLVIYHQTHHTGPQESQSPVSILPLTSNNTSVTHIIIAAVHLNDGDNLTLNDDPPSSPKFTQLWDEVAIAQATGIKVLALLGGAAKGSFQRLSGDQTSFNFYYSQLHTFLTTHSLSGIDLDVEEETPLPAIIRLIDRLRSDFGPSPSFTITLAPVLPALLPNMPHLSGFSYFDLENLRRDRIDFYTAQLYCGWGDAGSAEHYLWAIRSGWDPRRVVLGTVSCPENGSGWVDVGRLGEVVGVCRRATWGWGGRGGEAFGGVASWEYFNGLPGGVERPWEWAGRMGAVLGEVIDGAAVGSGSQGQGQGQAQMERAQHPWPAESVKTLEELGFGRVQAVMALNRTGGNVEYAAGLLFDM